MRGLKLTYLLSFIFCVSGYGNIKNVGVPRIYNFHKSDYQAGTQNWDVAKDSRGFMYFANNDGLVEYDGTNWKTYQFSRNTLIRKVYIDENDQMYIGNIYNDFGVVKKDSVGNLQYESLRHLVDESIPAFGDVWKIYETQWGIVFQSFNHIHFYKNGKIRTITAPNLFQFSFYTNDRLYVQDRQLGLMEYVDGKLVKLKGTELLDDTEVWFILPYDTNVVLIGTSNKGVFTYNDKILRAWENDANELLKKNKIFSSVILNDGNLAFGTIQDGLLVTNRVGDILQHINKKKGLQNNTVLSMNTDSQGNLWLGLDNGIDYVQINSPFTFLYQPDGLGSVYATIIHDGRLYVGTNSGLYVKEWPEENIISVDGFQLVPGTGGQVWHLGVYDGILMCGHNNGTFQVEGKIATQISDEPGGWTYFISVQDKDHMIGGTYNGLNLFKKMGNEWVFKAKIKGFKESCRTMVQNNDATIWMSHGFKGIYRMKLNQEMDSVERFSFYNADSGFPQNEGLGVYVAENQAVFSTPEGIYGYVPHTNGFDKSMYFSDLFEENQRISYLQQDGGNNIWYFANDLPGVLRYQEDGGYINVTHPFKVLRDRIIGGFESIYIEDNKNVFIGLEDGLAHYSPVYSSDQLFDYKCYIRRIENFQNDSLIRSYDGHIEEAEFPYRANAIRFSFTSPQYDSRSELKYSYYLENFSTRWSDWSGSTSREFTNLKEGNYVFKVKALNVYGKESLEDDFEFVILPPWYRTVYALIGYFVIFFLVIVIIIRIIIFRINISKRKERLKHLRKYRQKEQQYRTEAIVQEKEIIRLRNERLRSKMKHRDKELANQTLNLIHKNRYLLELKEEILDFSKEVKSTEVKTRISKLIRSINKEFDNKKQWELFETAFDEVHEDFLDRLKNKFPDLTPNEIKLSAYLRMNISSKEIASLMNISVRGVEISRYRLRKKLNLDRDINLTKYVMEL